MPPRKRGKTSAPVTEVSTLWSFSAQKVQGIAPDGDGNLFVSFQTCIYKISADGKLTVVAGGDEKGYLDGPDGLFTEAVGIAVDTDGCLIVAECGAHSCIRKVALDGQVSTVAGDPEGNCGYADGEGAHALFQSPTAVTLDGEGNTLVADMDNNCIRKVAPDGTVSVFAGDVDPDTGGGYADGPAAKAMFDGPQGVAVGADGSVYVADCNNNSIRKISRDGEVSTLAGCPPDVANDVDGDGNTSGHVDGAGDDARFEAPCDLAVDIDGTIVVADSGNYCIRKVTPEGVVSTLAGPTDGNRPSRSGYVDGPANKARFDSPQGVAIDMDGNVLVADHANGCVRMITHTGLSRGAAVPRWPVVKPALAANLMALLDDERFADVSFGTQAPHPPHAPSAPIIALGTYRTSSRAFSTSGTPCGASVCALT